MLKRLLNAMGLKKKTFVVPVEVLTDQPSMTQREAFEAVQEKRREIVAKHEAAVKLLHDWRKVGEGFFYLGLEMSVVRHSRLVSNWSVYHVIGTEARYVNQVTGALCEIRFSDDESFAMAKTPNVHGEGRAVGTSPRPQRLGV